VEQHADIRRACGSTPLDCGRITPRNRAAADASCRWRGTARRGVGQPAVSKGSCSAPCGTKPCRTGQPGSTRKVRPGVCTSSPPAATIPIPGRQAHHGGQRARCTGRAAGRRPAAVERYLGEPLIHYAGRDRSLGEGGTRNGSGAA
jgi:hypothetical protein